MGALFLFSLNDNRIINELTLLLSISKIYTLGLNIMTFRRFCNGK